MEDTLRVTILNVTELTQGLNPCFNGRYSQRNVTVLKNIATKS